jgi:hypothetical protein
MSETNDIVYAATVPDHPGYIEILDGNTTSIEARYELTMRLAKLEKLGYRTERVDRHAAVIGFEAFASERQRRSKRSRTHE